MQYFINIPQITIAKQYPKLNITHAAILYFMRQFIGTTQIERHEEQGKTWYWFATQKVIDELPILQIKTKRGIRKKFEDILQTDLMERKVECNKTYFHFTEHFFKLFGTDGMVGTNVPTMSEQNDTPSGNKCSTNHNTNINIPISHTYIKECFEEFLKSYPSQDGQYNTRAFNTYKQKELYKKQDELLRACEHYKATKKVKDGYIFNPNRFLEEEIYKAYTNGIPTSEEKKLSSAQKFRDEVALLLEKLEWLEAKWGSISPENRAMIKNTGGAAITREGKDLFSYKEVAVIKKAGGLEELLYSHATTSTQEQIEGLIKRWK